MILWPILLLLSGQAVEEPKFRWISESEVETGLRECGFKDFSIEYDDGLQSHLVEFSDAKVSDDQLRCAFAVVNSTSYIPQWPEVIASRYYQVEEDYYRPIFISRAKAFFADNPEYGTLPHRKSGEPEAIFGPRIVEFCDTKNLGLIVYAHGGLTPSDSFSAMDYGQEPSRLLHCVMHASVLTDMPFGFIGNDRGPE